MDGEEWRGMGRLKEPGKTDTKCTKHSHPTLASWKSGHIDETRRNCMRLEAITGRVYHTPSVIKYPLFGTAFGGLFLLLCVDFRGLRFNFPCTRKGSVDYMKQLSQ